jgi:cytochrome P450
MLLHVSVAIVGLDGVDSEPSFERLYSFVGRLSEGANVEWSTRDHREVIREALEAKGPFIAEFFVPSFARREALSAAYHAGELQEAQLPFDLLTLLAQHRDHFQKWHPDVFANEATLFMVANVGSPANALAHILAELLGWLADHPADWSRVEDPYFLRSAANEALRLHPASPYVVRQALQDTILSSGRVIHAGEYVTLQFGPANRDPAVFSLNPDRFDLSRDTLSSARASGLSFGAGPHTCIGGFLTIGDPQSEDRSALGTAVRILLELFRGGVRLDPDAPPCLRTDNTRNEYAIFPVLFTKL